MRNGQKCGITRNGLLFLQNMTAICQVHNAATHTCHAKTQKIKFQDATKCIVMYCIVISTRAMCVCICTVVCICIFCEINHNQLADVTFPDATTMCRKLSTHWSSVGQFSSVFHPLVFNWSVVIVLVLLIVIATVIICLVIVTIKAYIWHQMAPWTFVVATVAIWRHMPSVAWRPTLSSSFSEARVTLFVARV